MSWLMKSFAASTDPEEISFNTYLNTARVRVENAFGRLKSRWRILYYKMELDYMLAPKVILTCCILHNIVESNKDFFNINWLKEKQNCENKQPTKCPDPTIPTATAENMRNVLKNYLVRSGYPLRKSKF